MFKGSALVEDHEFTSVSKLFFFFSKVRARCEWDQNGICVIPSIPIWCSLFVDAPLVSALGWVLSTSWTTSAALPSRSPGLEPNKPHTAHLVAAEHHCCGALLPTLALPVHHHCSGFGGSVEGRRKTSRAVGEQHTKGHCFALAVVLE